MDNRYELLAAAPSSRPNVAIEAGREWFLSPERVYSDYRQMAAAEAKRSDCIEVVAIATPNHSEPSGSALIRMANITEN